MSTALARKPCKVCNHPQSKVLMSKVYSGEITYADAAKAMNIPQPTVWACFKNHWQNISTEEGLQLELKDAQSVDQYIEILKQTIGIFTNRLLEASGTELPFDLQNERALATLSKEARGLMRDILEFQGKLTTGIHVQYNILNVQFNQLTSFLFSELCPADKAKLLAKLPELVKEGVKNDRTVDQPDRTVTISPPRAG